MALLTLTHHSFDNIKFVYSDTNMSTSGLIALDKRHYSQRPSDPV